MLTEKGESFLGLILRVVRTPWGRGEADYGAPDHRLQRGERTP